MRRGIHCYSLVRTTVSTTISFRFFLVIRKFGLSFAAEVVVVVVVVVVISQQGCVLCWDVGFEYIQLGSPPNLQSHARIITVGKGVMRDQHVCQRKFLLDHTHTAPHCCQESVTHHATPSCRTGGSGAPYSTHDRRRHSATGDWGDNKQASNKQQTSKQTPNPQSTTLIFSSYHSYIHTNQ